MIITSYLFPEGRFSQERLDAVLAALDGDQSKLVIDLSCRRKGEDSWFVAMNKWQTITDMEVNQGKRFFSDSLVHQLILTVCHRIHIEARAVLLRVSHTRR